MSNRTPEQVIEKWIVNSVQYDFDETTGALRVSGSSGAGRRILRALENAGWQLVRTDRQRGIETR